MSNTFNISVKPEIAALEAKVDLVRGTDVPNIQSNINDNETKIDTVDSVVDLIKLKTDLLPPVLPKCQAFQVTGTGTSASYVDLINVTGNGIFYYGKFKASDNTTSIDIKITIDGITEEFTGLNDYDYLEILKESIHNSNMIFSMFDCLSDLSPDLCNHCNIEFKTGFRLQYRRTAGAFDISWHLLYGLN